MSAGQVGGGNDAFNFEKFVESFWRRSERERSLGETGATGVVEVDQGEHLAANGFVADPKDEVVAPLARFDGVGESKKIGADAFGVDGSFPPEATYLASCYGL
jgi:hypothetical protein